MADPEPDAVSVPLPVSVEAVLRELALFELRCDGADVTDKLLELCLSHSLDPVTLANELLAFVTSKALDPQLSPEALSAFEHEVLSRRDRRIPPPRRTDSRCLHDVHTLQGLLEEEEEEQLLDSYCTPAKGPQKRSSSTPENPHPKRSSSTHSPYKLLTPNSFSPSAAPSPQYSARTNRGSVVASFGPIHDITWEGRGGVDCTPKPFSPPERSLSRSYSFMFQRAADVREVLLWRMEQIGAALRSHHCIPEFGSLLLPAQGAIWGPYGSQCGAEPPSSPHPPIGLGDGVGAHWLRQQWETEPQIRSAGGGPRALGRSSDPFGAVGAAGVLPVPRAGGGGGGHQQHWAKFGPFIDTKHEQVESCRLLLPFAELFRLCVRSLLDGTRSAGTHLVFVPSQRDAHHDFVYPQPPFVCPELPKEDKARVHFMPDPCTLDINGVVLGLTSTDLLFHMGAEEISSSSGTSDRFTRILQHILTQRSFYPLYPPAEEMNVDYESFSSFASLPVTPHVLIIPSELRYFVKEVLGCVCINPGRLTKGRAAGTYGQLCLQPRWDGEQKNPCVAAQVVRI
uniref:DNA polymerase alpha subunit B n=1 Tax=Gallus gallus TaxID=9031 RepID=A0A8V0XAX4_CHICK